MASAAAQGRGRRWHPGPPWRARQRRRPSAGSDGGRKTSAPWAVAPGPGS